MQLLDLTKLTAEERAAWRKWNHERWEAVESVKAQELVEMTDTEAWDVIKSLMGFGDLYHEASDTSGLVEQQALFSRLRRA